MAFFSSHRRRISACRSTGSSMYPCSIHSFFNTILLYSFLFFLFKNRMIRMMWREYVENSRPFFLPGKLFRRGISVIHTTCELLLADNKPTTTLIHNFLFRCKDTKFIKISRIFLWKTSSRRRNNLPFFHTQTHPMWFSTPFSTSYPHSYPQKSAQIFGSLTQNRYLCPQKVLIT